MVAKDIFGIIFVLLCPFGLDTRAIIGTTTDPVVKPRLSALGVAFHGTRGNRYDQSFEIIAKEYTFTNFMTVSEEVDKIIADARKVFKDRCRIAPLPWENGYADDKEILRNNIISGINMDGSMAHLSWMEWFRFGSRGKQLEFKVITARRNERRVKEQLEEIAENEHDMRDILLLQHFVLEQMSPFKRYALRNDFFSFMSAVPGCWTLVYSCYAGLL